MEIFLDRQRRKQAASFCRTIEIPLAMDFAGGEAQKRYAIIFSMLPVKRSTWPMIAFISDDLPAPFAPISETISPFPDGNVYFVQSF